MIRVGAKLCSGLALQGKMRNPGVERDTASKLTLSESTPDKGCCVHLSVYDPECVQLLLGSATRGSFIPLRRGCTIRRRGVPPDF